jgi:hypothetical protein
MRGGGRPLWPLDTQPGRSPPTGARCRIESSADVQSSNVSLPIRRCGLRHGQRNGDDGERPADDVRAVRAWLRGAAGRRADMTRAAACGIEASRVACGGSGRARGSGAREQRHGSGTAMFGGAAARSPANTTIGGGEYIWPSPSNFWARRECLSLARGRTAPPRGALPAPELALSQASILLTFSLPISHRPPLHVHEGAYDGDKRRVRSSCPVRPSLVRRLPQPSRPARSVAPPRLPLPRTRLAPLFYVRLSHRPTVSSLGHHVAPCSAPGAVRLWRRSCRLPRCHRVRRGRQQPRRAGR